MPLEAKNKETPPVAENLCSLTRGLYFSKKTIPKWDSINIANFKLATLVRPFIEMTKLS